MNEQDVRLPRISTRFGKNNGPKADRRARRAARSTALESLEPRWYPSGTQIPVTFNIPADVAAMGVYAEVSGTLTASYTNNQSQVLASGTLVFYDSSIGDYSAATSSSALTFELSGNGATIDLPNTLITAGQIVIGVGSAPPVSYSSGSTQPLRLQTIRITGGYSNTQLPRAAWISTCPRSTRSAFRSLSPPRLRPPFRPTMGSGITQNRGTCSIFTANTLPAKVPVPRCSTKRSRRQSLSHPGTATLDRRDPGPGAEFRRLIRRMETCTIGEHLLLLGHGHRRRWRNERQQRTASRAVQRLARWYEHPDGHRRFHLEASPARPDTTSIAARPTIPRRPDWSAAVPRPATPIRALPRAWLRLRTATPTIH